MKHHSINHSAVPDQPEGMFYKASHFRHPANLEYVELLEAVRASLRAKVTALAEDNWMFEAEDQVR